MSIKVSILVPVYNVEVYLEECLESIRQQTLKEIEVICVNDGSSDGSLDILKAYEKKDPRFKVISQKNGGYGKAMNVASQYAKGDYIGIVEPDDFIKLSMYEDLYSFAYQYDLDFVKADFYRFLRKENGDMQLFYNKLDETGESYGKLVNPSEKPHVACFNMNTWSGIYKRSFLEVNNIRYHETPGAAFQDNGFFWQTTIYAQKAMFINKAYYMNRRDNPNSSVNSKEKVYCMNDEYAYIKNILQKNPDVWQRFKHIYTLKKFHNYIFTLNRIADVYKREYINEISKDFKQAEINGEISKLYFTAAEWDKLMLLINDKDGFYYKFGLIMPGDIQRYRDELFAIKNSTTFKVGKVIMYIPCAIKRRIISSKK